MFCRVCYGKCHVIVFYEVCILLLFQICIWVGVATRGALVGTLFSTFNLVQKLTWELYPNKALILQNWKEKKRVYE